MSITTTDGLTATPRPVPVPVCLDGVPMALRELSQWVLWRYELSEEGKWTKIPYQATRPTHKAASTRATSWSSFASAAEAYQRDPTLSGIGFVVTEASHIVGVDIDHCLDAITGEMTAEASDIVTTLDSYAEITPSARGLRLYVAGTLPEGRRKHGNYEMYTSGRYLTVTGATGALRAGLDVPPTVEHRTAELAAIHARYVAEKVSPMAQRPAAAPIRHAASRADSIGVLTDDRVMLERARNARNGAKFTTLYDRGDWRSLGYPSQSEADLALCSMLAHWTRGDHARTVVLFCQSALFRPGK